MKLSSIISFEIKRNLRLFIVWTISWFGMILLLMPFYDTFSSETGNWGELFQELPEAFRVAFGINEDTLSTITGYINTELIEILILSASILGSYLGIRTIAKEISNKSLLFVVTKPVNRVTIFLGKAISIIILTILTNVVIFSFVGVTVELFTSSDIPYEYLIYAFSVVTIYQLIYFALGLFLGIAVDEGVGLGVGIMLVVLTFILNIIANISEGFNSLKFLTTYFYLDLDPLLTENAVMENDKIFLMGLLVILFILIGILFFNRRDIDT